MTIYVVEDISIRSMIVMIKTNRLQQLVSVNKINIREDWSGSMIKVNDKRIMYNKSAERLNVCMIMFLKLVSSDRKEFQESTYTIQLIPILNFPLILSGFYLLSF